MTIFYRAKFHLPARDLPLRKDAEILPPSRINFIFISGCGCKILLVYGRDEILSAPKGAKFTLNFAALKIVKFRAVKFYSYGYFGLLCGEISPSAYVLKDEILSRCGFCLSRALMEFCGDLEFLCRGGLLSLRSFSAAAEVDKILAPRGKLF